MPRRNLGDLVGRLPATEAAPAPAEPVAEVAEKPATDMPTKRSAKAEPNATEAPAESAHYLSLVRKDTRLREDQLAALTVHARRLNRAKAGGVRITENTLIRIGVDLLLDRIDTAAGVDEASLKASLNGSAK